MKKIFIPMIFMACVIAACSSTPQETAMPEKTSPPEPVMTVAPPQATQPPMTEEATQPPETTPLMITSPAFVEGEPIPIKFSCDGEDISPALAWTDPPEGTLSFALIMDDPDAPGGTWVHWVLYNIPPETRMLPENVPAEPILADGSEHGKNSWGRADYGGPCPPSGTHRYFFKLYALDTTLDEDPLLGGMEGHILAEAQLMGVFSR